MKLDVKEGGVYSQKEIAEKMGVKPNTFSKSREAYQEHLCNFCDFEVDYSTKPHKYKILKVEDIEYFKKPTLKNKKIAVITDALYEENCKQPVSTAARGSRKIKDKPEIKALGLTDGSLDVYCRIATTNMYGTRDGRIKTGTHGWIDDEILVYWDKKVDEYIILDDDQINEYFTLIAKGRANTVVLATKAFDRFMEKKKHTKEEREKFNCELAGLDASVFIFAKKIFKEKYGGTPFWACKYKHFDKIKKL